MSVTFATVSPATSIVLPNPALGDSEQRNIFTKFNVTMDATVHSTIRTDPIIQLLLSFNGIEKDTYELFITWYLAARGIAVKYTDYSSVNWLGQIINEPVEIETTGRLVCDLDAANNELANFKVEFAGKLL